MASRSLSRALKSPVARQLACQPRSFLSAPTYFRAGLVAHSQPAGGYTKQQVRGLKTIDFAGVKEEVYGIGTLRSLELYAI